MNEPAAVEISEPKLFLPHETPPSPAVQSAARWFWWIAGLSLINTLLAQSGSETSFVMGLGFTVVSDAVLANQKVISVVIDAIAIGFFVFVGLQATKGKMWAFYLGILAYALDALIYVLAQDWMPVAFHVLALFFIARGAVSLISSRQKRT
ncbi:hypothetical protein GCM10027431_32590 [Lysobacter rhizosphaerae]